jgi:hypothetical protein
MGGPFDVLRKSAMTDRGEMKLFGCVGELVAESRMGEPDKAFARSVEDNPLRFAVPNSVTT